MTRFYPFNYTASKKGTQLLSYVTFLVKQNFKLILAANSIINPNKNKKGPKQSLTMVVVNSNQL